MEIWPTSYREVEAGLLVLIRVSTLLFMFPFFNSRVIPVMLKVGLALLITVVIFPVVDNKMIELPGASFEMLLLIAAELIMGLILGLLVQVFFEGVRMMGQVVGFQTGFAITNILDPQNGIQTSILSNMAFFVAMILFLLLNGHHIILSAIRESFEIVPVGSFSFKRDMFQTLVNIYGDMFVIAIKLGAPAIAILLLTKAAFGLVVKLIPQMNIMVVAFPVQIVIGLLFFGISLDVLLGLVERYLVGLRPLLTNTMKWLTV